MAFTDSQKIDLLYKKLFGVTKTDTSTNKGASNETIASPALNRGDKVWLQASDIPATAPAANTSTVRVYYGETAVKCVADSTTTPTSSVYPTWKTTLTDWIPPEFGSDYLVKVYVDGAVANVISSGTSTQIFDAGISGVGEWYFDYQAGVLNFVGSSPIPASLTSSKFIYISGYRYIGNTGISSVASSAAAAFLQANLAFAAANAAGGGSSNLTVSLIDGLGAVSNVSSNVTTLRFDTESGFDVAALSEGIVKVGMNSTFKYWKVDGVSKLTAIGIDTVNFLSSDGITITADGGANPQSITFGANTIWHKANGAFEAANGKLSINGGTLLGNLDMLSSNLTANVVVANTVIGTIDCGVF